MAVGASHLLCFGFLLAGKKWADWVNAVISLKIRRLSSQTYLTHIIYGLLAKKFNFLRCVLKTICDNVAKKLFFYRIAVSNKPRTKLRISTVQVSAHGPILDSNHHIFRYIPEHE
jgi:hypothetical protein